MHPKHRPSHTKKTVWASREHTIELEQYTKKTQERELFPLNDNNYLSIKQQHQSKRDFRIHLPRNGFYMQSGTMQKSFNHLK